MQHILRHRDEIWLTRPGDIAAHIEKKRSRHRAGFLRTPSRQGTAELRFLQRRITRWEHGHVLEAVQKHLDENPQAMRQRRETVEHRFGMMKAGMRSKSFDVEPDNPDARAGGFRSNLSQPAKTLMMSGIGTFSP